MSVTCLTRIIQHTMRMPRDLCRYFGELSESYLKHGHGILILSDPESLTNGHSRVSLPSGIINVYMFFTTFYLFFVFSEEWLEKERKNAK